MAKVPMTSEQAYSHAQDIELAEQHEVGAKLWSNPAFQERLSRLLEIHNGKNPRRRLILEAYLLGASASSLQPDELRVLAYLGEMKIIPERLADHVYNQFLRAEANVAATRGMKPYHGVELETRLQLEATLALPPEVKRAAGTQRKPWVDTRKQRN